MTVGADKLVRMAEQIAANVTISTDTALVAEKLAEHLVKFWDPRMRDALVEHIDGGGAASPAVRMAVDRLRAESA